MRVFGLSGNAERMVAAWSPSVRQFFEDYLAGVNAYIATKTDEHPLELSMLDHTPQPWRLEDAAVILQFIALSHSVNFSAEAVAQAMLDAVGPEHAQQITPLNVNPDRAPEALAVELPGTPRATTLEARGTGKRDKPVLAAGLDAGPAPLHLGSNNWVVGPQRSATGKPILVNDPHLDARLLPGPWYPIGMSSGDFSAAGVALPGLPGILIGRTDRVAFGVTNAYGDVQDLFILLGAWHRFGADYCLLRHPLVSSAHDQPPPSILAAAIACGMMNPAISSITSARLPGRSATFSRKASHWRCFCASCAKAGVSASGR